MKLIEKIFELSAGIRYVAIYEDGKLDTAQTPALSGASSSESDKYEELFVNPVLLTLARQRGNLDCGGARFVVVGYGNFNQLVIDRPGGHISVCFQLGENPIDYVEKILALG